MPVIKSAIKKLRQARRNTEENRGVKRGVKELLDAFKKKPGAEAYSKLVSAIDKAAKTNIIHKNKAARLKSRLSKLIKAASSVTPKTKPSSRRKSR